MEVKIMADIKEFLSTPSARRATFTMMDGIPALSYFYPRPPRGGRHQKDHRGQGSHHISIHALREEGDPLDPAGAVADR